MDRTKSGDARFSKRSQLTSALKPPKEHHCVLIVWVKGIQCLNMQADHVAYANNATIYNFIQLKFGQATENSHKQIVQNINRHPRHRLIKHHSRLRGEIGNLHQVPHLTLNNRGNNDYESLQLQKRSNYRLRIHLTHCITTC